MRKISDLKELKELQSSTEKTWLLLYKSGSQQSDCAFSNFDTIQRDNKSEILCSADVNKVRDIHPVYNISSVPSLLYFEKNNLKNIVKGCHSAKQFNSIFDKSAYVADFSEDVKPVKNVTVYTTPTCSWCTTVKRHLDENGIQYREVNVAADQKAAEAMIKKSGQQGVPQTEINGQIVVGFDKTRINSLLGIN